MTTVCPHCSTKLPPVRDAFCPECGNDLDDPPRSAGAPFPTDHRQDSVGGVMADTGRCRPVGIAILTVLHVGGGILLGAMQIFLLTKLGDLEGPLRTVGLSPALLLVGTGFLALLAITSGVGLWLGRTWGWWLGSFYYVYAIARSSSALLTVAGLEAELAASTRGPEYYYVKHIGRIIVHLLILLYLFQGHVLRYFALDGLSKWKAVLGLVGACAVVCGVFALFGGLAEY